MQQRIKVYGADWCSMTRRVLMRLDRLGVEYEYIDVDHDTQASEWVKEQNDGKEKKPTLDINGRVLTSPNNQELDEVLRAEHLLSQ
jgi:glutaredoxin